MASEEVLALWVGTWDGLDMSKSQFEFCTPGFIFGGTVYDSAEEATKACDSRFPYKPVPGGYGPGGGKYSVPFIKSLKDGEIVGRRVEGVWVK